MPTLFSLPANAYALSGVGVAARLPFGCQDLCVRATWKYHGISAARLEQDLAAFPAKVAHIEELIAQGVPPENIEILSP